VPRRAGVSTFAFGGNNAHALVEGFTPLVHVRSAGGRGLAPRGDASPLAIVGFASIFPGVGSEQLVEEPPNESRRFARSAMPLPRQAHLLTDVEKQLDVTQLLALAAAERAIGDTDRWSAHRERIGVLFGLRGRTPRAVAIAQRHYGQALRQRMQRQPEEFGLTRDEARLADLLWPDGDVDQTVDAYTLMGLMPNVAASRVAHTYDFNGPSLCMDAGACTLVEIMRAVERWLLADEVDLMLAGALSADVLRLATSTPGVLEGASVVALATTARARANAWPIHGYLTIPRSAESPTLVVSSADGERPSLTPQSREVIVRQSLTQVVGLAELARAVSQVARGQGGPSISLRWPAGLESARPADTAGVGALSSMPLAIAREHRADASA
jgi:hypothetical protein